MYLIMKRILLITILTHLKIAVILANSVHSTILCICKLIADIFQLPAPHLLDVSEVDMRDSSTQNNLHCNNPRVSTSAQTEKELKQMENVECKSSTDVLIYNLNSTHKLVITQGNFTRNQCESCKSAAEITIPEESENITTPIVRLDSSNISYMSIESDVIDSKIENGSSSSSTSSAEKSSNVVSDELVCIEDSDKTLNAKNDSSKRVSFGNADNTCLNSCNDKFNLSVDLDDFECLNENNSENAYVKCDGTTENKQKTSSPLIKLFQSPQNSCTNLNIFNADQSRITENKDAGISINSDNWENGAFGKDFKRRLSLPAKLNTTNTSFRNFKLAQEKLIEDALKNTPRHEKSLKEIKYPFSSEISLDSKDNDGIDDKGVFSCSSYESLPVSEHLRNAFNNNTLLSLYNENLHNEDKPDFSCIDNLVETFIEIKSNLSVPNLAQSKMVPSAMSRNDETEEKEFEPLNKYGVLAQSSVDERILKDYQKPLDAFIDTKLVNDKKNERTLCSEINLNTSVVDIWNALDRFVTREAKLVSEKVSKCLDKGEFRSGTDVNSGNNEQSGKDDKRSRANKTFKQENQEENNIDENKLNQTKCTSLSPLKYMLSDSFEWSDVENTILSPKDKSEINESHYHGNLPNVSKHSYHKIAFIDESPSHEKSRTNQNTSEANCQDHSLNKYKEPMLFEISTSTNSRMEANNSAKNDNLLPVQQLCYKSFGESTEHQSTLFEENTSSAESASDNSEVTVKELSVAGD